jgi:hypothetical protein
MKINANDLTFHLRLVSMKDRIPTVAFGKDFSAEVVDIDDEVVLKVGKTVKFPSEFAVMDLKDFLRIVNSFSGDIDFEIKDTKLVIDSAIGRINYQLADPKSVETTLKNFDSIESDSFGKDTVSLEVDSGFLDSYNRFVKLVNPDIVEFSVSGKKLVIKLVSTRGHEGEVEISQFDKAPSKSMAEKINSCKVSAKALSAVLDGIHLPEEETFVMSLDTAVKIVYRDAYTFIISRRAAE